MHSSNPTAGAAAPAAKLLDRRGRVYVPAVGPRLKVLLQFIFAGVALLGATGAYLIALRLLEAATGNHYENQWTIAIFMVHVEVGVLLVVPFLFFGFAHLASARTRKNRPAVRLGILLFLVSILVGLSGLALIQLSGLPQLPTGTWGRDLAYYLHVLTPLAVVVVYVLHRYAGPDIKWRWGGVWGALVAAFVLVMYGLHYFDPRPWFQKGSVEGEKYFLPSAVHTPDGRFISAETLMMDSYCLKCHQDVYNGWFHSAHHFSSFNNPAYLFSVKETREVALKRDGNVKASRWCAGCHDPVPFLSGKFDDPNYDIVNDPTAHAGITCTVCHAITNIDSTKGNAAFTIEEPLHYPFATSDNAVLQWVNNQLVKAKPDFHKKTFLKPFHRTAEFCSTCHKVSLPMQLNHYKEFLRGQNHHDTFLVSGVSGRGARSFYYPPVAKTRCAECHMPLKESQDFGSRDFDGSGQRKIHDHLFPGGNTGLPHLLSLLPRHEDHADGFRAAVRAQEDFLKDKKLRIDIFGLKEGGTVDGNLLAPLRPELPKLKPGETYLVEVVIRTLAIGHPFTQGTADSNEVWVDFEARAGNKLIGRSGGTYGPDDTGKVDEWSHFVNLLMLDRDGKRINRRNPQDIFTPLYDHQIPPGAAQVVHYEMKVPEDVKDKVELRVRLRYRKFDFEYMSLVHGGDDKVPKLPVVDICDDRVTLLIDGDRRALPNADAAPPKPEWQRWNDYGIGYFLTALSDPKKPGLSQAEDAFRKLLEFDDKDARANGYLNLVRVYFAQGRLSEAVQALNKIREEQLPAPWWTVAWFTGLVDAQNGLLDEAAAEFEKILNPELRDPERKFDFTQDFVVVNELGNVRFKQAQGEIDHPEERNRLLRLAVKAYERTLEIEPEDLDAHDGLHVCYRQLGEDMPAPAGEPLAMPADEKDLRALMVALGNELEDVKLPRARRLDAAVQLGRAVADLGRRPTKPGEPKLPLLLGLRGPCREVFLDEEADAGLQAAAAQALAHVHREAHTIFIPDTNAKDRAVAIHRKANPAAAHASQTLLIYSLHRPGAPGVAP